MPSKTDQTYGIERDPALNLTADEVARLTRPAREVRVGRLVEESRRVFDLAVDELIAGPGHLYVGAAALFSGGNDSTALLHLFHDLGLVDLAIHANTGVGIEATREFVRATCADLGIPLDERHPPIPYRDLVLEAGFPGPAQHYKMFQRLKERAIMRARADLVTSPRRERLVLLAGRRKDESARRSNVPLWEREGSTVWISPIALWTKLDLNTYRLTREVPTNQVANLIHMSGECLCGSFAKPGELDEIEAWYPDDVARIRALEAEVYAARAGDDPGQLSPERCSWGWGARRDRRKVKTGALCSSCDVPLFELERVVAS